DDIFHGQKQGTKLPYHDGELEVYIGGRFFAVTGHHLDTTPATVEERPEQAKKVLGWLLEYQRKDDETEPNPIPAPSVNGHHPAIHGDLNLFLARLRNVSPSGNGYTACCPAHDDKSPSLSVARGRDGRILVKCFAGCSAERVVSALGLT